VSVWVNAIFYTEIPPAALIAKVYIAPAGLLLSLVFFFLAYRTARNRASTWERIKAESVSRANAESVSPVS
jgi:hypothetical protein